MDTRVKKILWFAVSTAIIAGMIYFADIGRFLNAIATANGWFLIPAFILGFSVFPVWAFVWYRFFMKLDIQVSYPESLQIFFAGQFMNSVTPIGQFGGEPFMAYIISRNTEASYEKSLSISLSSDIVNSIPVFSFVIGGAAYLVAFSTLNQLILKTVYFALLILIFGGAFVYFLWFRSGAIENRILGIASRISEIVGRGKGLVDSLESKLDEIEKSFEIIGRDRRSLLKIVAFAHLGFVFSVFCLYSILLSVGFSPDFTPLYFILALSSLGNFSPTPGGSGTYEALMAGLLSFFLGINFATALVVAIIFRLTTFWPGLIVGYLFLNKIEKGDSL
ncbi:MAG: lysylphosphatidylglycerol synthase transmembrane domain-containing protein [Candidatus Nanohaloarchaea archaeon]